MLRASSIRRHCCQHGPNRHLFFAPSFSLQWRELHQGPAPWLRPGVEAGLPLDFKLDFDSRLLPREQVANAFRPAGIVMQSPESTSQSTPWETLFKNDKKTGISVSFSRHHVVHPWNMKYLVDFHPCTAATVRHFLKKSMTEPLWWHAMIFHYGPGKSSTVVNLTIRRKIKKAFREALQRKGYDETGRKLAGDESAGGPAGSPVRDYLYGSVRLSGSSARWLNMGHRRITAFFEELLEDQLIELLRGARQQQIREAPPPARGQKKTRKKEKVPRPEGGGRPAYQKTPSPHG